MNGESQIEQDKLEQEQRREFYKIQLQERVERRKADVVEEQVEEDKRSRTRAKRQAQVKAGAAKVKKAKKNINTAQFIIRIISTGGLDIAAWLQLAKERPFLTFMLLISFILLIVFILLTIAAIIFYLLNLLLPNPEMFMGPDNAALKPMNIIHFGR